MTHQIRIDFGHIKPKVVSDFIEFKKKTLNTSKSKKRTYDEMDAAELRIEVRKFKRRDKEQKEKIDELLG